jgi:hypothetical protein
VAEQVEKQVEEHVEKITPLYGGVVLLMCCRWRKVLLLAGLHVLLGFASVGLHPGNFVSRSSI